MGPLGIDFSCAFKQNANSTDVNSIEVISRFSVSNNTNQLYGKHVYIRLSVCIENSILNNQNLAASIRDRQTYSISHKFCISRNIVYSVFA